MKIQFRVQENPLKTLHLFFVCGKKYFAIFFSIVNLGKKNIRSQKCCICYLHRKNTHICLCTQAQLLFPGHFPKYFTGINAHIWYLSWQGFIHVPVILALVQCSENEKIMQFIRFSVKSNQFRENFREIDFTEKPVESRVCIAILGYCKLLVATSSPE